MDAPRSIMDIAREGVSETRDARLSPPSFVFSEFGVKPGEGCAAVRPRLARVLPRPFVMTLDEQVLFQAQETARFRCPDSGDQDVGCPLLGRRKKGRRRRVAVPTNNE